jgi:hypothetical protein
MEHAARPGRKTVAPNGGKTGHQKIETIPKRTAPAEQGACMTPVPFGFADPA